MSHGNKPENRTNIWIGMTQIMKKMAPAVPLPHNEEEEEELNRQQWGIPGVTTPEELQVLFMTC